MLCANGWVGLLARSDTHQALLAAVVSGKLALAAAKLSALSFRLDEGKALGRGGDRTYFVPFWMGPCGHGTRGTGRLAGVAGWWASGFRKALAFAWIKEKNR